MRLPARPRLLVGLLIAAHVVAAVVLVSIEPLIFRVLPASWLGLWAWDFCQTASACLGWLAGTQALLLVAWSAFGGGRAWRRWAVSLLLAAMLWWAAWWVFATGMLAMHYHRWRWVGESFVVEKFAQFALVTLGVVWMQRRGWAISHHVASALQQRPWQFSLKQLLIGTTACCVALGLCRLPSVHFPRTAMAGVGTQPGMTEFVLLPASSLFVPAVLLSGLWLLLRDRRLSPGMIFFAGIVLALVALAVVSCPTPGLTETWLAFRERGFFATQGAHVEVTTIVVTLLVLRLAGYRLVRRE